MSLLNVPLTSLRKSLPWSNSLQAWQEHLGDVVLMGGVFAAAALCIFSNLAWWELSLACGFCLIPALVLGRMGWLKVFGPVLYYDMIRQARRSRFAAFRFFYVLLLAFLLFSVTVSVTELGTLTTNAHLGAQIAERYFDVFMVAQFITVVLLTPAYVGGAIAEEKDRKTLEFMLATDLLNREIVLSKLASRLANLALVVLTGLPILSILQFLGGVDPNLVLASFAVTAMTIAGQAGVSILCSVVCKRPREAVALAYLTVIAYYAVSLLLALAIAADKDLAAMPIWFGEDPPSFAEAVEVYNKGNLVVLIVGVKRAGAIGALGTALPILVRDYAIFHGLIALGCSALAVGRLRRASLAESYGTPIKSRGRYRLWQRPPVGSHPMLWKEIHCESIKRSPWVALVLIAILLVATFLPAWLIVWDHWKNFYQPVNHWNSLAREMNVWLRIANTAVGCLMMLAVAVRASTSISSERDKQTFDTLLTTPLDSNSMLFGKWVGSLLSVRFGLILLVLIWAVGIVTGGLHVVALPLVIAALLVYTAFSTTLGLWFSTVCRSSLRAMTLTIVGLIGLTCGHWVLWLCCAPVLRSGAGIEQLLKAQAGILTPPFVMAMFPFSSQDYEWGKPVVHQETQEIAAYSFAGLVTWTTATMVLFLLTRVRFSAITHRRQVMVPDRLTRRGS
jgi:ABC-type transport system involved in multi-copper enzyme maturation permease subunit